MVVFAVFFFFVVVFVLVVFVIQSPEKKCSFPLPPKKKQKKTNNYNDREKCWYLSFVILVFWDSTRSFLSKMFHKAMGGKVAVDTHRKTNKHMDIATHRLIR